MTSPQRLSSSASSERYQALLNQIAWNIRRTLDLETIWQQTVDGIGQALGVSRCLVGPYSDSTARIIVKAEYLHPTVSSILDQDFHPNDEPSFREAITTLEPVTCLSYTGIAGQASPAMSCLAIATCYQDQPNGLVVLQQCDRPRVWSEEEIHFVQQLADQVGTAIAHTNLFNKSQALAQELQRVNEDLLRKHQELEEARRQAEEAQRQAEEASRLKSEFLANTSHELRTPLNGMIGFLKLVIDGMADDSEERDEFINEAYKSAVHLMNVINDILDIAKIEAGKMELAMGPVKLVELLNAVDSFTRTHAEQKGLYFKIVLPATRDDVILLGNYQRLLQVMLNLVGNAIKFTHEGGITVRAEVIPKTAESQGETWLGLVKLSVADSGIGVSLDKQDKLFQSFSQVDGSRTRQYGGTGLGLTISQKLVEAMGGEVNFYSMGEGLGSTVTFTTPLYQEPVFNTSQGESLLNAEDDPIA